MLCVSLDFRSFLVVSLRERIPMRRRFFHVHQVIEHVERNRLVQQIGLSEAFKAAVDKFT